MRVTHFYTGKKPIFFSTERGSGVSTRGKILFFSALLAASVSAHADLCSHDPWSNGELIAEGAFLLMLYGDYRQTRYISAHSEKYYEAEAGWAIGKHPTLTAVNNWFAFNAVAHVAIANCLSRGWRRGYQAVTLVYEADIVNDNYKLGVKWSY